MKTILIERVANGFLVRPFEPSGCWAADDRVNIYVYRKVEELVDQLPELLKDVAPPAPDRAI